MLAMQSWSQLYKILRFSLECLQTVARKCEPNSFLFNRKQFGVVGGYLVETLKNQTSLTIMFCVRSYEMLIIFGISLVGNLRPSNIRSHTLPIFYTVIEVVNRPERGSSPTLSRSRLKFTTHFFTVVYDGVDSLNVVCITSWIFFGVNLLFTKYLTTPRSSILSIF